MTQGPDHPDPKRISLFFRITQRRIASIYSIAKMNFLALFFGQRKFLEMIFEHNKKGFFLLGLTLFEMGFLALGAFLFITIEGSHEIAERDRSKGTQEYVKSTMLAKYPNLPGAAVDDLFQELSSKGVKGIITDNTTKWTYGNSFLFSATLLTTIGYGHLSPSTELGKIICMLFSSIGIPLTLLMMSCYLEKLNELSCAFKSHLFRRLGNQYPVIVRLLHVTIVMSLIVVGCFLLPAAVFDWLEVEWTYLDAIYFCFISLTTVGLGDFVPGIAAHHPHVELYRFGATIYLIAGVTVMMFLLAVAGDYIQNYNSPYTIVPVAIISEKCPFKIADVQSYGAIEISISNSTEERKKLLQV